MFDNQFFMKKIWSLVVLAALAASGLAAQNQPKPNYEFRNGYWFNGTGFTAANWYTVDGKLTQKRPSKIDSIIDLEYHWVVPPLGDAYCASVTENPQGDKQLDFYMGEGAYYLQTIGNTQEGRKKWHSKTQQLAQPEMTYANGGITCTLGKPFLEYEPTAQGIRHPQAIAQRMGEIRLMRKGMGDGYWFIDNKEALNANWPKIKAQNPDLVTIYLLDAANSGGKENKGLTPDVAKIVIKKAHKADLRVYAHVETVEDVRLAIKLGVDGLLGLPGNNWDGTGDAKRFQLADDDLKKLAKKQIAVVPLYSNTQLRGAAPPAVAAHQRNTMKRMLANNVLVVVGSNDPSRTTRAEVNYWFGLGEIEYLDMIRVVCQNTPQAIFPKRKVGRIESGYEASFLVLEQDPTQNVMLLRAIQFKVKNGLIIK
jgi:hypothetical protein